MFKKSQFFAFSLFRLPDYITNINFSPTSPITASDQLIEHIISESKIGNERYDRRPKKRLAFDLEVLGHNRELK